MIIRIKQLTLIFGDIIALYAALFLMIGIRYGVFSQEFLGAHLMPFTIIFAFWLIIFYIAGLYDLRVVRTSYETLRTLAIAAFSGTVLAVIILYLVPYFHIAPKTSLVIFSIVFLALGTGWRLLFSAINPSYRRNIVIVGSNKETDELYAFFKQNPHVGYNVIGYLSSPQLLNAKELKNTASKYNTSLFVIAKKYDLPPHIREEIHRYAARGIEVMDSSTLYELALKKMSLEFHEDLLSLEPYTRQKRVQDAIKRPIEFITTFILVLILSPVLLIIFLLIKLTSRGPGLYTQIRFGKYQKTFRIYKFRTMAHGAEKNGAQWSSGTDDPRVTRVGKFLRRTHIDEFPQLLNVLQGTMSLVGPRAERPEFVTGLLDKLPYYELRHIIKPGITGWAQTNYRYGSSIADARAKLQYDLWYAKHRSLLLDLLIILRTIKHFFAIL